MKEYATSFYKGKHWKKLQKLYMTSKNYICERCGGVAEICHHKKYISPENITDTSITLNTDNLECLCRNCHNQEHMTKETTVIFDDSGQVIGTTKKAPENDIEGLELILSRTGKGIQKYKKN